MVTNERLDELATLEPNEHWPDDGKLTLTVQDVRDLVRLIPVVRAAIRYDEEGAVTGLLDAVEGLVVER